jgi:type I restriction enzyme S subunit
MSVASKNLNGFGNVPGHWDVVALPEAVFFQEGPGLRKWQWTESGMKVINVTNILGDGRIDTSNTSRFISIDEYEKSYRHFAVDANDIVIASSGNTYGKVGRIAAKDLPLMMNTSVIRLRSLDRGRLDDDFLYAFLRSEVFRNQVESFVIGSAQPNFGPTHLKRMVMPLPPLPVQRRLAGILSAYDEMIENSQRRIRILESMAHALYREWFLQFRFPGHESHPRAASPLGEIPSGWDVRPFTEIADVLSGGTPKTDVPEYWDGAIPFFTPRDAPDCFYVQDTDKHVTEIGLSNCASDLYPPDTVFITARGTVGKVALPSVPMAMNQSCYALRGKAGIPQRYLFLLTLQQVDYLKTNTGGATFDTIVVETFRRMQVVKPSFEVIDQFAEKVDAMFEQVSTLQRQVQNLRRTRDLLLPRLLSGRVEVEAV